MTRGDTARQTAIARLERAVAQHFDAEAFDDDTFVAADPPAPTGATGAPDDGGTPPAETGGDSAPAGAGRGDTAGGGSLSDLLTDVEEVVTPDGAGTAGTAASGGGEAAGDRDARHRRRAQQVVEDLRRGYEAVTGRRSVLPPWTVSGELDRARDHGDLPDRVVEMARDHVLTALDDPDDVAAVADEVALSAAALPPVRD